MLTIYRRHEKHCEHRGEGRKYRRCKCPIWIDGFIGGREIRESLRLRDWTKANTKIQEWEAEEKKPNPQPEPTTIAQATAAFLADAEARKLRPCSVYKYKLLFRRMEDFAAASGLRYLVEFDLERTRAFRATWNLENAAALKCLDYLRAFFRFAHDTGWIPDNPAKKLKAPQTVHRPTLPFSQSEMSAILAACDFLESRSLKALVLLLRYSGLRMSDAVSLQASRVLDGKLMVYTAKTGTPVYCPLPPFVVAALEAVKRQNGYFFWTGESNVASVAGNWRRRLAEVFTKARVQKGHPHRFRDTFAVELLLAGVPLERVSILLGHSTTRITERHYAPWVSARQEQLEADVRRTWEAVKTVSTTTKGTREVHGRGPSVN